MNNQFTTSWNDTQKLLAFIVTIAFIVVIYIWMFHPPATDAASTGVLNTLVGTLGGFAGMILTFYFGSSRSSANKDSTIATLVAPPSPPGGHGDAPTAPVTPVSPPSG